MLSCLNDAVVVYGVAVINDNNDNNGVLLLMLLEAAAAVVNVIVIVIHIIDGCRPRRGGRMMRLPDGGRGSYYPHCWMGSKAHGFVWLPPHLTAKTATPATSTSAGGPDGPPP